MHISYLLCEIFFARELPGAENAKSSHEICQFHSKLDLILYWSQILWISNTRAIYVSVSDQFVSLQFMQTDLLEDIP